MQYNLTALDYVKGVSVDLGDSGTAASVKLELDNRNGFFTNTDNMRSIIVDNSGWIYQDGSEVYRTVADRYFFFEPTTSGMTATAECLDILAYIGRQNFIDAGGSFDGQNVADSIGFLLNAACVGPLMWDATGLEDLSPGGEVGVLSMGKYEEPAWLAERGGNVLDLTKNMLNNHGGYAGIWVDGGLIYTGCRFCRTKRSYDPTSTNYWRCHATPAGPPLGWPAGTGCITADIARDGATGVSVHGFMTQDSSVVEDDPSGIGLTGTVITSLSTAKPSVISDEYANYVSVQGKGRRGEAYSAVLADNASITAWGFYPHVISDDSLRSQSQANALCFNLYYDLSFRLAGGASRLVDGECIFHPNVRPGRVMMIHTIDTDRHGLNGKKVRITNAAHGINRGKPYTKFQGRQIS